jgi:uncharacterized protein (TIGR03067 family)
MARYGVVMGLLLVGPVILAAEKDKDDKKALQGKWKLVKLERNGKLVDVAEKSDDFFHLKIAGDKMTTEFANGSEEGTYTLDPNKKPKTIDVKPTTSEDKGKTLMGIYSVEGDTLKLCVAEPGEKRPKEFKADPAKVDLFILKRVK